MKANHFRRFSEYPVRPEMVLGESLACYFYRYLAANGYKVSIELYRELKGLFNKEPEHAARSQAILQTMVGTKLRLERATWLPHQIIIKSQFHVGGEHVRKVRFCSMCINEKLVHFAFWSYPLVEACPEHGCVLVSKCYQCGRLYSWVDLLPGWFCQCGASIQSQQPEQAIPRLVTLSKLVASATDVILPEDLKVRWVGSTLVNRYNFEKLFYLLEGPYRYLLDDITHFIPEKTLNLFEPH